MTAAISFLTGILATLLAVWAIGEHRRKREARRYAEFLRREDERAEAELTRRIRQQDVIRSALRGTGSIAWVRGGEC